MRCLTMEDKIKEVLDKGLVSTEEFGFITSLINRFKSDITKKEKFVQQTMGEINQLRINLKVIQEMALNMIAAQERAEARTETAKKLREDRKAVSELKKKTSRVGNKKK